MALILVDSPITNPAVVFDKLHLEHLSISCAKTNEASATISIHMRPYFTDTNGNKVFSDRIISGNIADAYAAADALAAQGDTSLSTINEQMKQIVADFVSKLGIAGQVSKV